MIVGWTSTKLLLSVEKKMAPGDRTLFAHFSSGEHNGQRASCYKIVILTVKLIGLLIGLIIRDLN